MSNPLACDLDHVLAHTAEVWEELRGGRLFLTGGTGFFGCWLLESFAWACDALHLDAAVTVLTRSPEAFQAKAPHLASHRAIRLHRGDVVNFEFPSGRFSHVIHAASDSSPQLCRQRPLLVLDTLVDGTRRVLDFAVTAGASRLLFTSSGAVYGSQHACNRLPETAAAAPDTSSVASVYGEGKRMAELLCNIYRESQALECVIARCFAFVGPYLPLDAHFAIGNFLDDGLRGRPIRVQSDGTAIRSYLYAADLAAWLWNILVRGLNGRTYNVGSEQELTIAETARTVAAVLDSSHPVEIACQAAPGATPNRYVPSTARVRNELGLREWISLPDAVRRTAAALAVTAQTGEKL